MVDEALIAEVMLDPPLLRIMRARAQQRAEGKPPDVICSMAKADRVWRAQWVGTPLSRATPAEYLRVQAARLARQTHFGFWFMHRVLHLERSVPALFSEYADGSLRDLKQRIESASVPGVRRLLRLSTARSGEGGSSSGLWCVVVPLSTLLSTLFLSTLLSFRATYGRCPPPLWLQIAYQLTRAMTYIRECTPLAHVDLKPDNVLFQVHMCAEALLCADAL